MTKLQGTKLAFILAQLIEINLKKKSTKPIHDF